MLNRFKERMRRDILVKSRYRKFCASLGSKLNKLGYLFVGLSRSCVRYMNHHVTHEDSDWYINGIKDLHKDIDNILKKQREEYGGYYYFYGQPYQSLSILGVYGERSTEERFDSYGLRELVSHDDYVLDIGCNCGFVALYTSYRTGCRADGVDINPYMIQIGNLCADYLRIGDSVNLSAVRIQDLDVDAKYSIVFSFATHWTDDENYRVPLREHFERCASFLKEGGRLLFETHAADVGNSEFYEAIESFADIFEIDFKRDSDKGTRHLYLFNKV